MAVFISSAGLLDVLGAVKILVGKDGAVNGKHLSEKIQNVLET